MAESSFGPRVRAQPLGSQQDSNFLLVAAGGAVAGRYRDRVLTEGW